MTTVLAAKRSHVVNTVDALGVVSSALDTKRETLRSASAASHAPSPEEGLALMSAYLRVEDAALRQAILDIVCSLATKRA